MSVMLEKCIYCESTFDPARGEGDHIIPCQLGEFRGDKRFRGICRECNSRIGRSEQQFLQCGPESLFRRIVKPAVPSRRKRGQSYVKAAMGAPTPEFSVDSGGHHQLVQACPDNPRNVNPLDQVVICDEDGQEHCVRLFPGMRPEQLKARSSAKGIGEMVQAWFHCDFENQKEYYSLLAALWPKAVITEQPITEMGNHDVRGCVTMTVNDHYFRVIAKIGFHYYLTHSRRGLRGSEPEFAALRNFIMEGGDFDEFFNSSNQAFATPFRKLPTGGIITAKGWCHVLAATEVSNKAIAHVQLFVGPEYIPRPHQITLGMLDCQVVVPTYAWGHCYFYDDPQPKTGSAGYVEKVSVTEISRQ